MTEDLVAFEGVLGGSRRGQHDPATAAETVLQREGGATLHALGESAAVAAVEDEQLLSRRAVLELVVEPLGRNGGRREQPALRVHAGVVEPSAVVEDTVAGQVDKQQVLRAAAGAELGDPTEQLGGGQVEQSPHLEGADGGIVQHRGERLGVVAGCPQSLQGRIPVVPGGDDEREPTPRRGLRGRRHGGPARARRRGPAPGNSRP